MTVVSGIVFNHFSDHQMVYTSHTLKVTHIYSITHSIYSVDTEQVEYHDGQSLNHFMD